MACNRRCRGAHFRRRCNVYRCFQRDGAIPIDSRGRSRWRTQDRVGRYRSYYSKNNDPISHSEFSIDVRGEAVALDLGSRGVLFALLKEDTDSRSGAEYIVLRTFNFPGGALPLPVGDGLSQVKRLSGKAELPFSSLPLLVRFRDPNDPKTVERVDPLDIGKSFGAGAKLTRATLEIVPSGMWPLNRLSITGEPATAGLDMRLPWLSDYYGRQFDGERFESASSPLRLANSLTSGAFRAGL
jgi:hypothetical protein